MKNRDYTRLLAELAKTYTEYSPKSGALHQRAQQVLIDGGSHALRLTQPFPPRIASAQGAWLKDQDGHDILDFWQGHLANLLGHNPKVVTAALAQYFATDLGLQTGFADQLQVETAELLCQLSGAERVRFTTSGTLASMYATMLARSFTGRSLVMKVGGGWHGAQPWALKGIGFSAETGGFQQVESEGIPAAVTDNVIVSGFNDPERLHDHFRQYGDQLAAFIVEPFIGVGGFLPASREYLRAARELSLKYGTVLIFDEVIAGFRFHAGNTGSLYGIKPDLTTFGKIMGGGMPVAAVAGREAIMNLVGRVNGAKVKFSGGTFSAHPASLLAAKTLMEHLASHQDEIYPQLAKLGAKARQTMQAAFAKENIYTFCTGEVNDVLPGSSLFMLHFPYRPGTDLKRPDDLLNPSVCDTTLSHQVVDLALLLENVYLLHCHGGVSSTHTEEDIELLGEACHRVARRIKPYL